MFYVHNYQFAPVGSNEQEQKIQAFMQEAFRNFMLHGFVYWKEIDKIQFNAILDVLYKVKNI